MAMTFWFDVDTTDTISGVHCSKSDWHRCLVRPLFCCTDHISPTLKLLHWLPVDCRVKFKISTLINNFFSLQKNTISNYSVNQ